MGKRNLYRSRHPFDACPFELFSHGSWQSVEQIRAAGNLVFKFEDGHFEIAKKDSLSNLRIRPRKATPSDCTCFLRPGVDICALLKSQEPEVSDEVDSEQIWTYAKINSIERKPHKVGCECQYYINVYGPNESLAAEKGTLSKEISILALSQICILQKLEMKPCESEYFRWKFSSDCFSLQETFLSSRKFTCDLTWLLVASVLKQIAFDVKSVQNKIVYEIVGSELQHSANTDNLLNAITFRVDNGVPISVVVPFSPVAEASQTDNPVHEMCENDIIPFCDVMELRRSKRRTVQPDRFLSEGSLMDSYVGLNETLTSTSKSYEPAFVPVNQDEDLATGCESVHSRQNDCPYHKSNIKPRELQPKLEWSDSENQPGTVFVSCQSNQTVHKRDYFRHKFDENHFNCIDTDGNDAPTVQRKNKSHFEATDNGSAKIVKRRRDYSTPDSFDRDEAFRKRSIRSGEYSDLITNYMNNIGSTIKMEEANIIDHWKEFKLMTCLNEIEGQSNVKTSVENEGREISEIEMLWEEMEFALASSYLSEENEDSNFQKSSEAGEQICQHEYNLDEQIGIICQLCGYVCAEITEVFPPFILPRIKRANKLFHGETSEDNPTEEESSNFIRDTSAHSESKSPCLEDNDNVWSLIPEFEKKLLLHQRKAFEFLWQNVAGSLEPPHMKSVAKKKGGCVISHAMGSGKTLLIIAFLVSYLKLFPGKRPLVLAPKTTLYAWCQEIKKWKVPIPVYHIHSCRTYRSQIHHWRRGNSVGDTKPNSSVMHAIHCLEKLRMWHSHPSILLMGYTTYLSLSQKDSKAPHRRYMSEVLNESTGILILDEGHNPRSTKSMLRKSLMKVKTDLRILLSGTLFQNNFEEYFNTLCLARPSFIDKVLKELDPKFKRKKEVSKQKKLAIENRARKLFLEQIASKIESSEAKDRNTGLNMLKSMTSGFIDVYEGDTTSRLLGLQCYTLIMKPTEVQHKILVKLEKKMAESNGYILELELMVTLGSIHPWLIKTAACVNKYFTEEELEELEKHKFELQKGSKIKFVVSLVHSSLLQNEKVLIFCHNIAPMNLLVDLFGWLYGWQRNEEILVLQGNLDLFERGRMIDKFEDPGGSSKILIASILACSEGVSLTAASRVILLDTEWNPTKRKQAIARAFRPGQEKMVYAYHLLITGTLEEDKYGRRNYKEWVSSFISSEELSEDPSRSQAENIEDDLLREIVEEDRGKSIHMIMKNEKASNTVSKSNVTVFKSH